MLDSGTNISWSEWLPFVPQSGHVYTLSADINYTRLANGSGIEILGFSSTKLAGDVMGNTMAPKFNDYEKDWIAAVDAGYNLMSSETSMTSGVHNFKVILNTNPSPYWTAEFKLDNSSVYGPISYTSSYPNPTINYVGFGTHYCGGATTDNFTLSVDVVPQPSALVLATLAGLGLLAYAWRKRK